MKNTFLFLSLLLPLFLWSTLTVRAQEITYKTTIDILHQSDVPAMKQKNAVWIHEDEGQYVIQYNVKHGRKIQTHQAVIVSDKYFDKAGYTWINPKKVMIRFFSTRSTDTFHCTVWGDALNSNGLQVDPEEAEKL